MYILLCYRDTYKTHIPRVLYKYAFTHINIKVNTSNPITIIMCFISLFALQKQFVCQRCKTLDMFGNLLLFTWLLSLFFLYCTIIFLFFFCVFGMWSVRKAFGSVYRNGCKVTLLIHIYMFLLVVNVVGHYYYKLFFFFFSFISI